MIAEDTHKAQIKGIREGLLATVGEGEWLEVQAALINQIKERGEFFKGARLALDVGKRNLHAAEMGYLRDKLSDINIALWAVLSLSPVTEQTAQVLGLATRLSIQKKNPMIQPAERFVTADEAIFIQKTVRSGNRISSKGHVVILGDVNPGAEILAGGNVIVWGRLRGGVQAGSEGNEKAVICALEINPIQLRIADFMYIGSKKKKKPGPETARIVKGQIVIEPWNLK
jgi:septum site-determining protein MinC